MRRIALAVASAALALAGISACGSSSTPKPKSPATSQISQKSFTDGETAGKSIALANSSVGQAAEDCKVTEIEQMPTGDVASQWMSGCELGALTG